MSANNALGEPACGLLCPAPSRIPFRKNECRLLQRWTRQGCSLPGHSLRRVAKRTGSWPGGILITASLPPGRETLALPCFLKEALEVPTAVPGTHVADGPALFSAGEGKRT